MSHASPENDRFFPSSFGSSPFLSLVSHLNHVKNHGTNDSRGENLPHFYLRFVNLYKQLLKERGFFSGRVTFENPQKEPLEH